MKITAIKRQKKRSDKVNVYLDGEFHMAIASEVALRANLTPGTEVDEPRLAQLQNENTEWSAREAALRLLTYRPRTEWELRQRLRAKGYATHTIDCCIGKMMELGLLDDREFARLYSRDRLRARPSGKVRLLAELRGRGVDPDHAEHAVDEVLADTEETEIQLARRASAKFADRPAEDPEKRRRRLYAFLARRGFSREAIGTVLTEDGS